MASKYYYLFDPPGFDISRIPKWYDYIASIEKLTQEEDPESEQAKKELASARETLSQLEAWRDEEQAKLKEAA